MQLREQQILMSSLMNFGRYVIKLNCYMVEIVRDEKETSDWFPGGPNFAI